VTINGADGYKDGEERSADLDDYCEGLVLDTGLDLLYGDWKFMVVAFFKNCWWRTHLYKRKNNNSVEVVMRLDFGGNKELFIDDAKINKKQS
jgi:hypothetical protein